MKQTSLNFTTLLPLFLFILLCACNEQDHTEETETTSFTAPESFVDFYQRFHRDSLFQIEHIIFPLEGLPDDADSLTIALGSFRWKRENWQMQRPFDFEMSEFGREIKKVAPGTIEEIIYHKKLPYVIVRRFSYLGDDWYLIYYAGMNRIRVEE